MPKIRLYHVRTLLWTYFVWTPLNLWFAHACWSAAHPFAKVPLRWTLYNWVLLHIAPLWALWDGTDGLDAWVAVVVAGSTVAAGLLIDRRWVRFLVIVAMSLWFFDAWCLLGIGV